MLRLYAAHHRNELVNLPPSNKPVRFDDQGYSEEVEQDTADMCSQVPGFRIDGTVNAFEADTDQESDTDADEDSEAAKEPVTHNTDEQKPVHRGRRPKQD